MKKKCMLAAVAIVATVGMAFAQTVETKPATSIPASTAPQGRGPNYVDKNGNGVCDTYEAGGKRGGRNQVGRKQGALRQGRGQGKFVDENKNGVCDRRETTAVK